MLAKFRMLVPPQLCANPGANCPRVWISSGIIRQTILRTVYEAWRLAVCDSELWLLASLTYLEMRR